MRDRRTGRVSGQGEFYVIGGIVILSADVVNVRANLREIQARLGYAIHFNELSHLRRIETIKAVLEIDCWDGYIFETASPLEARHHKERHIRARALQDAFTYLCHAGAVTEFILETRAQPSKGFTTLNEDDRRLGQKLKAKKQLPDKFTMQHGDKTEPLLWLADVLAGARSDHICARHEDLFPLLGHRILDIRTVFNNRG